jgi:hypothetical protein
MIEENGVYPMGKTHYIAMGGNHGCLPDNCSAYTSLDDAIGALDSIYELTESQLTDLHEFSDGYSSTELNQGENPDDSDDYEYDQGGEYCEISTCTCDSPWEHDETGSKEDWGSYAGTEEPDE